MKLQLLRVLVLLLITPVITFSTTIYIPQDYPTIQAGINASVDGDIIIVADGVYTGVGNKNLQLFGKQITLTSENGPDDCLIDCEGNGKGLNIVHSENRNTIISGFQIVNASESGIDCEYSDPTIENCIFHNNASDDERGGAIYLYQSNPKISGCYMYENFATDYGGAILCSSSSPIIENCTICSNYGGEHGAGISAWYGSPQIVNTIISYNTGSGGIYFHESISAAVTYCNLFQNEGGPFTGDNIPGGMGIVNTFNYNEDPCDQYYNIFLDPEFEDPAHNYYSLLSSSPCIDAGDPNMTWDPDNSPPDIGAYFFDQGERPIIQLSNTMLTFPNTPVGVTSEMPLTISNIGEVDLIIYGFDFGLPEIFSCNWNPLDSVVASGSSMNIVVEFTPAAILYYSDVMTILNNDQNVEVILDGPEADMVLSADSLYFPMVAAGSSSELPFTIYNTGNLDLVIYEISVGLPEIFLVEWNPNDTLITPGDCLDFTVVFLPEESALYTDFMTIRSNDEDSQVYLHGIEENATIEVNLLPHNLNILIPSWGGSFNYDIIIENPYEDVTVNFWIAVTLPAGGEIPVMMRNGLFFQGEEIFIRENMTQFVPSTVPSGDYIYTAYLSDPQTWEIISSDIITFCKVEGDPGVGRHEGWALYGWEGPEPITAPLPSAVSLKSAPNPFNPVTTISFTLPENSKVNLTIFDLQGRELETLLSGWQPAGYHQIEFNASQHPSGAQLPSGVYFARLQTGSNILTRKIMLIK